MEITFFVGSGISLKSGVPGVGDLTLRLFDKTYLKQGNHFFELWNIEDGGPLEDYESARPIQEYLTILKEEHDAYIENRLGDHHETSYEDLYSILDQIEDEEISVTDNYVLTDFIDRHNALSEPYRRRMNAGAGQVIEFGRFCLQCKRFIESVVRHFARFDAIDGVNVLRDLIRNDEITSINLFSLNHDSVIEQLCSEEEVSLIDGFSESDGEIRYVNPALYTNQAKVKLYKLHGGTNWYWVRDRVTGEQGYAAHLAGNIWNIKTDSDRRIEMLIDDSNFLTGINKLIHYNDGFFGELQYQMTSKLKQIDRLIISGYGWNDRPLNRKLMDWIEHRPETKLLIIHDEPDNFIRNSRYLSHLTLRNEIARGKVIFCEKWFEKVTMDEVLDFINS